MTFFYKKLSYKKGEYFSNDQSQHQSLKLSILKEGHIKNALTKKIPVKKFKISPNFFLLKNTKKIPNITKEP